MLGGRHAIFAIGPAEAFFPHDSPVADHGHRQRGNGLLDQRGANPLAHVREFVARQLVPRGGPRHRIKRHGRHNAEQGSTQWGDSPANRDHSRGALSGIAVGAIVRGTSGQRQA
jgi:hypothetical protein